jgi:tRNA (guanine-N7-)-methyltransferase
MLELSLDRPVPWRDVFGDDRPVEVEIGPGRGERLLAAAAGAPETNFFGIEVRGGAAEAIATRARARGLRNLRVVAGDVRWILRLVPDESVTAYHIHFPDPWPKTRHRERRLATPEFAREIARTLARGGAVHVASDLPALVERFAAVFAGAGLARVPDALPPAGRPRSSFEQRYARGGATYAHFARIRGTGGSGSR